MVRVDVVGGLGLLVAALLPVGCGSSTPSVREDCEVVVEGTCYPTQKKACAVVGCPLERCLLLDSHPAQVQCQPAYPESGHGIEPTPTDDRPEPGSNAGVPPGNAPGCAADAAHCCQPDGSVVVPGGCQPVHRDGEVPYIHRGPDGRCVPDEEPCLVVCLPGDARIETPSGPIPVRELAVGDSIFTENPHGQRIVGHVLEAQAVALTEPHTLVEVTLADGRRTRASPGHPTATGDEIGALRAGARLDGSTVVRAQTVPYPGSHTHDVLPTGPTGIYWADGIRLGSTLRRALDHAPGTRR
jgi:hypothetical protein